MFYEKLRESQAEFANAQNELTSICQRTSGNETLKRQIFQVINGYESQSELNGREMIEFLANETDNAETGGCSNRILNTIAQNLDASRASALDVILI